MSKRKIFPLIPHSLLQKNKYLYYILLDLFMGLSLWLGTYALDRFDTSVAPRDLFSKQSIMELFYFLWFGYFIVFLTCYQLEKKQQKAQKKAEADVAAKPASRN